MSYRFRDNNSARAGRYEISWKGRSDTKKAQKPFQEILNAIRDSLSDLETSNNEVDGDDKDYYEQDSDLGNLNEDEEPGWVMGTISKMLQQCLNIFQQKQIRPDKLMKLGWGDIAEHFRERDMIYGTARLWCAVVIDPQTDNIVAWTARQHLESEKRLWIPFQDNCQWRKGLLDQEAVMWAEVMGNHSHSNTYCFSCLMWLLIHHWLSISIKLNL